MMETKTGCFQKNGITFYTAETDDLVICVCPEKGGELSSVRYKKRMSGRELLFRGNDYSATDLPFKGRAPLMWPAVTRNYLPEDLERMAPGDPPLPCRYKYRGTIYPIGPSAFAKDVPWRFERMDEEGRIISRLDSSAETRTMYPFEFSVESAFRIDGTQVIMEYTVWNRDREIMFFSIGNHIGVRIPFGDKASLEDIRLRSSGDRMRHISEKRVLVPTSEPLPLAEGLRLDDARNVFNMVTAGYTYEDNFFQVADTEFCFEIRHRVDQDRCRGVTRPGTEELFYTLYGNQSLGFICTEPWIGGINSLNTGKGLIHVSPGGRFCWQVAIELRAQAEP